MKTKNIIICAVFAAIIAVMSQLTLPIGTIPFSMGIFAVMLSSVILGMKRGFFSVLIFVLLGATGLPVFAGFKAGLSALAGPTGGYITGYILMSLIIGFVSDRFHNEKFKTILAYFAVSSGATAVCYAFGTLQFMIISDKNFLTSLMLCVVPFILPDIIKCAAASIIGYHIKSILIKEKLL